MLNANLFGLKQKEEIRSEYIMDFFSLMKVIVNCMECYMLIFSNWKKRRDNVGIYFGFLSLMKVIVNCIECYMLIFSEWNKIKR